MKIRVRALVRGAAVSLAAITMTLTVSAIPAAAATTVTSFTPISGPPGTLVTITGGGFTAGTGVSSVTFNGVATTYNVADDQHLTATVPVGATTGKIAVTASGGIGTSTTDFVVPMNPVIGGFSPSTGSPGTAVAITGSGFTGVNSVKFNGTSATFNFLSDAQVSTTVPAGATTGKIDPHDDVRHDDERFELHGELEQRSDHQQLLSLERRDRSNGHGQRGPLHGGH